MRYGCSMAPQLKTNPTIAVVFLLLVVGIYLLLRRAYVPPPQSYNECVAQGNILMETYPSVCVTKDGRRFVEPISTTPTPAAEVSLTAPLAGDTVKSPFTIRGQARGFWFFEAQTHAVLRDNMGNELATAILTAQGEWMTTEFVPFEGTLIFTRRPATSTGTLTIFKANPSGLPENEKSFTVPIRF